MHAAAGSRTCDLSITSPPSYNHYTTEQPTIYGLPLLCYCFIRIIGKSPPGESAAQEPYHFYSSGVATCPNSYFSLLIKGVGVSGKGMGSQQGSGVASV